MLVLINLGNKAHFLREKRINLLFRSTNNSTNIEIIGIILLQIFVSKFQFL